MIKLTRFSVNQPVTISMMVLAIILLGIISFNKLGIDLFPDLNNPRIYIELKAGEKPPEEIEKKFVEGIESTAMRQKGVTQVSSVCRVGSAIITLEYDWDRDMDDAFLEIQKALTSYNQHDEMDEINISRLDPNATPVLLVAFSSNAVDDMNALRKTAENYIRNELIRLEGIAEVKISGQQQKEVLIAVNQHRLNAYHISTQQISGQLQNYNQNISGGSIQELGRKYIVKGMSMLRDLEDIGNIILTVRNQINPATGIAEKVPIQLKEVADISFRNKEPDNMVRINGKPCLGLSIYKETRYNTVKVVDALVEKLDEIQTALPGYEFQVVDNQGRFISSAIREVEQTALYGILLAVFILFIFLRRIGTTFIISIAIPISIIATFNLMYFNGLTLNIMTLGGLALGAGMLVDNAIVVMENIFRNMEGGKSLREAAIEGTAEVGGAITASTITTIVVFLPIVYLHGASGELFADQAWTVAFSLFSSLFVAILVIPMLVTLVFRKQRNQLKEIKSIQFGWYSQLLAVIIKRRLLVIVLALALVGLTAMLIPRVGSEYFPKTESHAFSLDLSLPEGTRLQLTASTVEQVESILYSVIDTSELQTVYSHIGPTTTNEAAREEFFTDEHTARMRIMLKPAYISKVDSYIRTLTGVLAAKPGLEFEFSREASSLQEILGNEESPIIVEVTGEDPDQLESLSTRVKDQLTALPTLKNIRVSLEEGAPQVEIDIDRYRAGLYNLSVTAIADRLTEILSGKDAGELDTEGELKDMIIKTPDISLKELQDITIQTNQLDVPLTDIASIRHSHAPREIIRRNQNRVVKITAGHTGELPLDRLVKKMNAEIGSIEVPANYTVRVTGEEMKRRESFGNLSFAMVLSIILVYMVMASQFESLVHPFTILLTIPLAGVGTILIFYLLGMSLNVMAYIGIILLAGIAVNDSIILVDAVNQHKARGVPRYQALLYAGQQRIRPIIMTTLTTILALLPLTFGFGESASLRAPMALAVIGGLITSTILTLVVIPCVYYLLDALFHKEKAGT